MNHVRAAVCLATLMLVQLVLLGCHTPAKQAASEHSVVAPILMYRHIGDMLPGDDPELTVSPKSFNAQMEWLHKHGYHAISPQKISEALRSGTPLPAKPVVITLDDGWIDQYVFALPILQHNGLTATFFIYPGRIGADRSDGVSMTWPQLSNLVRQGMDIEACGRSDLTKLSPEEAQREIIECKAILESHLSHPVTAFAYPFGKHNEAVIAIVKTTGYRCAVGTVSGAAQTSSDLYSFKRIEVSYNDSLEDFVRKVAPGVRPMSK